MPRYTCNLHRLTLMPRARVWSSAALWIKRTRSRMRAFRRTACWFLWVSRRCHGIDVIVVWLTLGCSLQKIITVKFHLWKRSIHWEEILLRVWLLMNESTYTSLNVYYFVDCVIERMLLYVNYSEISSIRVLFFGTKCYLASDSWRMNLLVWMIYCYLPQCAKL